jgi:hypothetical protein
MPIRHKHEAVEIARRQTMGRKVFLRGRRLQREVTNAVAVPSLAEPARQHRTKARSCRRTAARVHGQMRESQQGADIVGCVAAEIQISTGASP